jgi:hypothetical protein
VKHNKHLDRAVASVMPFMVIAAKSRIPQEDADLISTVVLICLDEVKRGRAPNQIANTLTEHLATAQALWAGMANRPLYDQAVKTWHLWCRACNRDTHRPIALTTGEYNAVRITVSYYLRSLTQLEIGRLVKAKHTADAFLKSVTGQPQEAA